MTSKKKSERHFKKYQAEAAFVKDVEKFVKDYKTTLSNLKLSKKTKARLLAKALSNIVNDL